MSWSILRGGGQHKCLIKVFALFPYIRTRWRNVGRCRIIWRWLWLIVIGKNCWPTELNIKPECKTMKGGCHNQLLGLVLKSTTKKLKPMTDKNSIYHRAVMNFTREKNRNKWDTAEPKCRQNDLGALDFVSSYTSWLTQHQIPFKLSSRSYYQIIF